MTLVSVVVVTYNSRYDIAHCLEALQATAYPRLEITVVDNASTDGTPDLVATSFPSIRLIRSPDNLGFAGGCNLGLHNSQGNILLILNPDVRLRSDAIHALADVFTGDARLGIVGAKLLYPDGETLQHAGGVVEYPLATTRHHGYGEKDCGQYEEMADVPFVTGAALALRRETLAEIGSFDAGFFPVYYEDVDLCYRARAAGWRVAYAPTVVGLHRTAASLDPTGEMYYRFYHANRVRFILKHYTTQQLLLDFLPAEARRLQGEMPIADRRASHQVYETWGTTMTGKRETATELEALAGELEKCWLVQEQPFRSHVPIVGPLIARFRTAWNNISTRWYVQPIVQQQVVFNAAVARAVVALARHVAARETTDLIAPVLIAERLKAIEERLSRLEQ